MGLKRGTHNRWMPKSTIHFECVNGIVSGDVQEPPTLTISSSSLLSFSLKSKLNALKFSLMRLELTLLAKGRAPFSANQRRQS